MASAIDGSIKTWINSLLMDESDKQVTSSFFDDEEIGFNDLLQMKAKKELIQLGIELETTALDILWNAISNLQDGVSNDAHEEDEEELASNHDSDLNTNININSDSNNDNGIYKNNNINNGTIDVDMSIIKKGGVTGLSNMGNTCFLDSAIQCLLNVPGFTHELAEEISSIMKLKNDNIDGNRNNNGNNGSNEENKYLWLLQLEKGDKIDVYHNEGKFISWYGATVELVELDFGVSNNNSKKKRFSTPKCGKNNSKNNKHNKHNKQQQYGNKNRNFKSQSQLKNRHQRSQSQTQLKYDYKDEEGDIKLEEKETKPVPIKWTIYVRYRTYGDTTELDMLNKIDYNRIDKPNTHGNKYTTCQHWRHDLKTNDFIDVWSEKLNNFVSGTITTITTNNINVTVGEGISFNNYKTYQVSRWDKELIAKFGTNGDTWDHDTIAAQTNKSSGVTDYIKSFFVSSNNGDNNSNDSNNNNNNRNYSQEKYHKKKGKNGYFNNNSNNIDFYQAWLNIIYRVHIKLNNNTFKPKEIYNNMIKYDESLGDGDQHDAIEALTVILYGIDKSLDNKFIYNNINGKIETFYENLMDNNETIYNNEFKWDINDDIQMCNSLIKSNLLHFGYNLVSKWFQGVEAIEEACLNCGIQRRLYRTFNELSLSVSENDVFSINVFYYSPNKRKYFKLSFDIPLDFNIKCLKFLILCQIYKRSNTWNNLSKYKLILLNKNINYSNLSFILSDNKCASHYFGNCKDMVLLLVPIITLDNNINNNNVQIIYSQLIKNNIVFFVLSISDYTFTHKWFVETLLNHKSALFNKTINNNNNNNNSSNKNYLLSYFNGNIYDSNDDIYCMNKIEYNIIFAYATNNKNNNSINSSSSSTKTYMTEEKEYDTTTITDEMHIAIIELVQEISKFNLIEDKIKYLEDEIKIIKNFIKKNKSQINLMFNSIESKFLFKCLNENKLKNANNTSIFTKQERIKACEYLNLQLGNRKHRKMNISDIIQKKLNTFWKNNNVSSSPPSLLSFNTYNKRNSYYYNNNNNNNKYYKKFNNLNECLNQYYGIRYMDKKDLAPSFNCNCDKNNNPPFVRTQRSMIIGPKSLIISLARGKNQSKQNHIVNFNENFTFDNNKYNLRSVCNHSGNTTKFGHYTASVKQLGTNHWYCCNDSYYSKRKYSCHDAVMMIYQKQ